MSNTLKCPHCGNTIDLTQVEEHQIEERLKEREEALKASLKADADRRALSWAQDEVKKAKLEAIEQSKIQNVELESLRKRDEEARAKELEFLRERQQMENRQKNLEIEKERAIIDARKKMEEEINIESQKRQSIEIERLRLDFDKRLAEEQKKADILKKSLDDATMKANQGSMQIQGEIQENALKETLMRHFPLDFIDDVPTGIKGADLIQTVRGARGESVGVIAWESKNTKAWSDGWVDKLKEDRLRVNASVSIIVSNVLPKEVEHFGPYNDIWVTEWSYVLALTSVLREHLMSAHQLRGSLVAKDEKMEILYTYLTSSEFRDKIQNIVESFQLLKDGLDSERRAMQRIWATREKQLDRIIGNTSGLYGDMHGLLGAGLQTIEAFELPSGEEE
ncbi:MAG: DUF2130 domain-containing protein [Candidatus Gracilibacteria bacterium]|nr:DUF2130 domain-containing protein [Candidatus Gracilibacteria bacterium]